MFYCQGVFYYHAKFVVCKINRFALCNEAMVVMAESSVNVSHGTTVLLQSCSQYYGMYVMYPDDATCSSKVL